MGYHAKPGEEMLDALLNKLFKKPPGGKYKCRIHGNEYDTRKGALEHQRIKHAADHRKATKTEPVADPDEVFDEVSLFALTSYNYIFVLYKRFPVYK